MCCNHNAAHGTIPPQSARIVKLDKMAYGPPPLEYGDAACQNQRTRAKPPQSEIAIVQPASVTTWIEQLKSGDNSAAQKLWERYLLLLVDLAANRLRASLKRVSDEEDLALSVFEEFRRRATQGSFPKLADREDFWQIIVQLTERRAIDQLRREATYRKHVLDEERLRAGDDSGISGEPLDRIASREPTPDEALALTDALAELFRRLSDRDSIEIVRCRLAGMTEREIAQRLQSSLRTVERRSAEIRQVWMAMTTSASDL